MWTSQQLLPFCLWLFWTLFGLTQTLGKGPDVPIVVPEGSDVILPCSPTTKLNLELKIFDWKKDGMKEVFLYDAGLHYNNGRTGQDEQFKGRVFHFEDELKNGNASIKILNMMMSDSGDYTCHFPRLQPQETFLIRLVVERNYRDRSGELRGAPRPSLKILNQTIDWPLLQCEVRAASPKPEVKLQDGDGNRIPAQKQESRIGGHYYVTLLANVTKTGHYHCVVEQEEISHRTDAETFVSLGKQCEDSTSKVVTGWIGGGAVGLFLGALIGFAVLAFLVHRKCITIPLITGCHQQKDVPPSSSSDGSPESSADSSPLEPPKKDPV